jgi:hypothetical protein
MQQSVKPQTAESVSVGVRPPVEDVVIVLEPLVSGLTKPVALVDPHDESGRLFVAEQDGLVRALRDGRVAEQPFLDLRGHVSRSYTRGLLSLAFHPDFPRNGSFFAGYTDASANVRVSQFTASPGADSVSLESERSLLVIPHAAFSNANGGHLVFGPDGYLYVGIGDGGGEGDPLGNAQDRTSLLGKILRVDVGTDAPQRYEIPPGNPYGPSSGFRPEIWAYGLRHPWRFSFDRETRQLWIGDIGEHMREEVDTLPDGAGGHNFGWPCWEGTLDVSALYGGSCSDAMEADLPVLDYAHINGRCAVVGGFVYRGKRYADLLGGRYLYGDYCSGEFWLLELTVDDGYVNVDAGLHSGGGINSYGEDDDGELYAVDHTHGVVYRVGARPRSRPVNGAVAR